MTTYEYLKFLNLQYLYCVAYSLFGGKCTAVSTSTPNASLSGTIDGAARPANFWEWLFGSTHAGAHTGPLGGMFDAFAFVGALLTGVLGIIWAIFSALSYTLSALLFLMIIGSALGILFIRYQELALYGGLKPKAVMHREVRSRWQMILDRTISLEPKAWKESVQEADIMLGELLAKLGYQGQNTHERLRAVQESAFVTLPNAWEAHRIRNFISAPSSDYILTQREAFRVLKLYEQVFEEFDFI